MTLKEILHYKISPLYLIPVFIVVLYSVLVGANWIEVKKQEIVNSNLANILSDKKIVLISDLHIRDIGYRENNLIKKINNIGPDIVFIAGEFTGRGKKLDDYRSMVSNVSKVLKQIQSKYGVYAVLGEGDLYSPSSREHILRQALKNSGVTVLSNEIIEIDIDNKKLSLIGLGVRFAGIKKLFTNINKPSHPSILLSHRPNFFMSGIDALEVNLAESNEIGSDSWVWQDDAYWSSDSAEIYFEHDGEHTIRILRREDGVAIDQILLTSDEHINPNQSDLDKNSCYIKHDNDILITAHDINQQDIKGHWDKDTDDDACNNSMIADTPDFYNKVEVPTISPKNYFEATFNAKRGIKYHVWLRMNSNKVKYTSDSVYVQFSDSIDTSGLARYQTGRTLKDIYSVDVILSGDTHGGQVRFPYSKELLNLLGVDMKYDQGIFDLEFTTLYVNRGIGWSGVPMRLFCRPEITQLSFVSQ
jgi:hypothetical protein